MYKYVHTKSDFVFPLSKSSRICDEVVELGSEEEEEEEKKEGCFGIFIKKVVELLTTHEHSTYKVATTDVVPFSQIASLKVLAVIPLVVFIFSLC